MKPDAVVLSERDDAEMMKRPNLWPAWPILPLKRKKGPGESEEGFIADSLQPNRVYLANMFMIGVINPLPFQDYDSPEAIVADGWKVD